MTPPPDPSAPTVADPRIAPCRRVVDELVEIGMNLARSLDPARGTVTARDPYLAYCRVSRALRLTLLLDLRLDALAAGGASAFAAEAALDAADRDAAVTDDAACEAGETPDAGESARPSRDRDREAPDEVLRYLKLPLIDLVDAICRGFGLSPEATAEAQAPFLALAANDDPPPPGPADRAPAPAGSALSDGRSPVRQSRALGP